MQTDPGAQYRRTQVLTAPPERLVLMLYDRAVQLLEGVLAAPDAGCGERRGKVAKVQEILCELMCALDFRYEISWRLYRIYEYCYRRLAESYVCRDADRVVEEVLGLVKELRDAWSQAVQALGRGGGSGSPSVVS